MFALLETWFDAFILGYVARVSGAIATALVPVAAVLITVYVILYGFAVMRGEVTEPFSVFAWKSAKVAAILGFALPGLYYSSYITGAAVGLQNALAVLLTAQGATAATTAFSALDAVNQQADVLLNQLWAQAGITRLDLVLAGFLFSIGTTVLLVIGAFVALLGRLVLTFGLAIGPLAILCLLFKPSARFFDSWLSFLLSAIVLSWFVFFALGMSLFVTNRVVSGIAAGGAFVAGAPATAPSAMSASLTYLSVMVLLAIILWQAPSLSSSLTGGASIQAGTQLVSNTLLAAGASRSSYGSKAGSAGSANQISKYAPATYALGRAAGLAIGGGGATARAAYQRVAQRGGGSS